MYYSEIPTKLDRRSMSKNEWIKARTQELYDMLPQTTLEDRGTYTDIRDEIITINYSFFGYVAKNTYVTDPLVTYDDKLQSALLNFCNMWTKYKFCPADPQTENPEKPKVKKYRTDLSFAVFFKPRLAECITRELNTIKYSVRRQVCMKAAEQLGKHWGQLTKDDIPKVKLSPEERQTLESIFNVQYDTQHPYDENSVAQAETNVLGFTSTYDIDKIYTEQYDKLEDLIIHEMIEQESKLDDAYLLKMAQMYGISFEDLKKAQPIGEAKLKRQLEESMDIKEVFEYEIGFNGSASEEE